MEQYGVLIVDDSAFMRRAIAKLLETDPQFFVVGIARNGVEALEKVERLRPDLVTMDVEMPEMDGLRALVQIMKEFPLPVVMLSNHTAEGAEATLVALESGAVDFFLKETLMQNPLQEAVVQDFIMRLKTAVGAKTGVGTEVQPVRVKQTHKLPPRKHLVELLVIGCSTGGPSALQSILPRFTTDVNMPILVIQHMPPGFTKPLAERFDTLCPLRVKEVEDGDLLLAGSIYVAKAGMHAVLQSSPEGVRVRLQGHAALVSSYKPSIDVALESAAGMYGERLLAVILTGMGSDGLIGCQQVKQHGGSVIVEAEESCVVYGMPKVVYEAGYADQQVPLAEVFSQIKAYLD